LPYAVVQNGVVTVMSRHAGQKHLNVISLAELLQVVLRESNQASNFSLAVEMSVGGVPLARWVATKPQT